MVKYRRVARLLIRSGAEPLLGAEYMSLCLRERILNQHARRAKGNTASPLNQIGFRPPLSVVGEPEDVFNEAWQMRYAGIPIAMDLDAKKRPKGMPIGEVAFKLKRAYGRTFSGREVLGLYRDWLAAHQLTGHPDKRIARIPKFLRRIAMKRAVLEAKIDDVLQKESGRRFAAVAKPLSLRRALRINRDRKSVMLAVANGRLLVDGKPVDVVSAGGGGAVIVRRGRLRKLARRAEDSVVLDCRRNHWIAWVDFCGPHVLKYFTDENADESAGEEEPI